MRLQGAHPSDPLVLDRESLLGPPSREPSMSTDRQIKILRKLHRTGFYKVPDTKLVISAIDLDEHTGNSTVEVIVNNPGFHEAYEQFEKAADLLDGVKGWPASHEKVILRLGPEGDLWRDPNPDLCYAMKKSSKRLEILNTLIELGSEQFYSTNQLARHLQRTDQALRREIGKINSRAKTHLHLTQPLILGRQDSGYRINPRYKIITK